MTTYGVTPAGFVVKPLAAILSDYQAAWLADVDPTADLSPTSPEGQILGILAEADAELWELAQSAWNAYNRQDVEGAGLDNLGDITGDPREDATTTQVVCTLGLNPADAPYMVGTLVANVVGNSALTFSNAVEITTGMISGGFATGILFVATSFGATPTINPNTLTVITTPVTGWSSITNPDFQTQLGSNEETDAAYQVRQQQEIGAEGGNNASALVGALIALGAAQSPPINVTASVIENYSDSTLVESTLTLPPHTFAPIVYDPTSTLTAAQIGAVILANKPPGIATVGTTPVTVTDVNLGPVIVNYTPPTPVPLFVLAVVVLRNGFTIDGVRPAIQSALIAAALAPTPPGGPAPPGQLLPGTPVVQSQLMAVVSSVAGVFDVQALFFSTVPGVFNTAPILIPPTEIATLSSPDIFVVTGSYP